MQWSDEGIVLSVRPLGDANAIVELLTRMHGRHLGLVRGGRSRRMRPMLQPGNRLAAEWRARLSDHLGTLSVELADAHAARIMDDARALAALTSLCALVQLLAEREPHRGLYDATLAVVEAFDDAARWPRLLARWELLLLTELGYGLDLTSCAATGGLEELIFVSPKTGRAVSAGAGEPFRDRLLGLPAFLLDDDALHAPADIEAGFRLTGFFLARHVYEPRGQTLPRARERLMQVLDLTARHPGKRAALVRDPGAADSELAAPGSRIGAMRRPG